MWSAGKYAGPCGRRARIADRNSSRPAFLRADTGKYSTKSCAARYFSSSGSRSDLSFTRSILFKTKSTCVPDFFIRSRARLRFGDLSETHLLHPQLISGEHLSVNTIPLYALTSLRDAPQPFAEQAPDGGGLGLLLRLELEQIVQARHVEAGGDYEGPV